MNRLIVLIIALCGAFASQAQNWELRNDFLVSSIYESGDKMVVFSFNDEGTAFLSVYDPDIEYTPDVVLVHILGKGMTTLTFEVANVDGAYREYLAFYSEMFEDELTQYGVNYPGHKQDEYLIDLFCKKKDTIIAIESGWNNIFCINYISDNKLFEELANKLIKKQ
jgi:hypothetical protein